MKRLMEMLIKNFVANVIVVTMLIAVYPSKCVEAAENSEPLVSIDFEQGAGEVILTGADVVKDVIRGNVLKLDGNGNRTSYGIYSTDVFKNSDWTEGMTLSAWVQTSEGSNIHGTTPLYCINMGNRGYASTLCSLETTINSNGNQAGFVEPCLWNDPANAETGQNKIVNGKWQLVTVVYDPVEDDIKMYIDGNYYSTTKLNSSSGATDGNVATLMEQVKIAKSITFGSWNCTWWQKGDYVGMIDDFNLWNSALSETEIQELYQETKAEEQDVFEMTKGGSIRIVEPYGLRFQVKMSNNVKTYIEQNNGKVGMFIFPADYLVDDGADEDVFYNNVEELVEKAPNNHRINLDLTSKLYENDGYWYGNGAIVNIKDKNMAREFIGIAYYEVDDIVILADTAEIKETTRSAAQVALLTHAGETSQLSDEEKDLLVDYIDYLKADNVEDSAPERYKVRGYASEKGLHIWAVQYVDNIVETGHAWTEQTHIEAQIWQHDIGYGEENGLSVSTYSAFWLDGSYSLNNYTDIEAVENNVTISDRGEDYIDGYRYEICYNIYIGFENNLENLSEGPYAFVQLKHHMPMETKDGFENSSLEYRDEQRYLWQDDCDSYKFKDTGIMEKNTGSDFVTNLEELNSLQDTWKLVANGYYSASGGDTFSLSQTNADNFIYETDILFHDTEGAASLVFRALDNPAEGCYVANIDKSKGLCRVFKFPGGVDVCSATLEKNKSFYHLSVEVVEDKIKLYVDGELTAAGKDDTYASGKLGLLTWNSGVTYQDVIYKNISPEDVPGLNSLEVVGEGVLFDHSYSKERTSYEAFLSSRAEKMEIVATGDDGVLISYILKKANGVVYDQGNLESGKNTEIWPMHGVSKMIITTTKADVSSSVVIDITNKTSASDMSTEDYRPQLHFTSENSFINDPNGLVYDPSDETWHMFYQLTPGSMSQGVYEGTIVWGHAVSSDLVNWTEFPVAIEGDEFGAAWSGSCVVDEENTSGFFTDNQEGESKLVAMYTSAGAGVFPQSLAYSKDHGVTWIKYTTDEGQPVLPDVYSDSVRDPKIFKIPNDEKNLWYMVMAGGRGRIFASENLKEWTLIQELTCPDGSELHSECPDLYPLEVLDENGNTTGITKWVYGAASEFYIIGDMIKGDDGYYRFQAEKRIDSQTGGASNAYAAQSYYNDPVSGRRITVHWMQDWSAPGSIPVKRWNGAQSLPLETMLKTINGGYVVVQNPVEEVKQLRGEVLFNKNNVTVTERSDNILAGITGQIYEVEAIISNFDGAEEFGFELRTGNGQKTMYKYNVEREVIELDKSLSGVYDNDVLKCSLTPRNDGTVKLRAIVDKSVIETFANDGDAHLIDLLFADESSVGMSFYTDGGSVTIDEITVYDMKSIYTGKSVTASEDAVIVSLDAKERVKTNDYFTVTANIFPIDRLESVEWIVPEGVMKISETDNSVTLQVNQNGNYTIAAKINGEFASTSVEVADSGEEILKGDLDGNGKLEQADLDLLQEFVSGTIAPEDWQKAVGDMDGDGELTVADILKLQQIVDVTKLSYEDVANGLTDLSALAKVVEDGEKSWESSAYDKASRYNEETDEYEGWFANSDWGYDSPSNGDGGIIAAEMEGPGVLTRIWSASPSNGHVKIWVDGKVVVDMPFKDLFGTGSFPFNLSELCYFAGRGANCYVPITYNESCKVVLYEGWGQYFQINYLTYGGNTKVEPFELPLTSKGITALNSVNDQLSGDLSAIADGETKINETVTVKAGESVELLNVEGSAAISNMTIKINDLNMTVGEDGVAHDWKALADLAISMKWDQEESVSVWAPLGGFFASQTGLNEYSSIASGVKEDGTMYSNWYMPYEKGAVVTITNDGDEDYSITYTIKQEVLEQENAAEQLRFHAKWMRASDPVFENNDRWPDTPFLELQGSGRYVGTSLHVYKPIGYGDGLGNGLTSYNPVNGKTEAIYPSNWWWGEGDEKFFVDGEEFPSWFGTGVEDYFGYAWGTWSPFSEAYHSQPFTNGGMWGTGNRLNNRFHVLDNVPFAESLEACMEKYHRDEYATWAFTNYFYLDHNKAYTDPYESVSLTERIAYYEDPYPAALVFDENGDAFIEGEYLAIVDSTGMRQAKQQDMRTWSNETWSNNEQVVFIAKSSDESVRFYLNIAEEGDYDLSALYTKAGDFGIYQHYIDGKELGGEINLYVNDIWSDYVTRTSEIYMGYVHLTEGIHILEAKCVGKDSKSTGYVYGMDYLKVSKTNTTHVYEAEDQYITDGTATYGYQGGMNGWSCERHLLQIDNGVGDYIAFNFYVNKAGYYDICAALTKGKDFGVIQHYIDGAGIGVEIDLYDENVIPMGEISLGHIYLEKGTHSFKAKVVDKNALSIGYIYGLDYLKVNEVSSDALSTIDYENTDLEVATYYSSNSDSSKHVWTQSGNFSGGNQLLFFGAAAGDYITVKLDVPRSGNYKLNATLCRASDFGIVQHYIDDVKIGNPINNYEGYLKMAPATIGEVYLTQGVHILKAVMIATDSGKSPGYLYALDKLTLQEVVPPNATSWRVEGEDLNVVSYPDEIIPCNQSLWWFDSTAWSQESHLLVKFNADNQSINATFDIKEDGEYDFTIALGKFPDFGKFRFAIDGKDIGEVIDSYSDSQSHSGNIELGSIQLERGMHELTITCVGTSGNGRLLGLDYLEFERISD